MVWGISCHYVIFYIFVFRIKPCDFFDAWLDSHRTWISKSVFSQPALRCKACFCLYIFHCVIVWQQLRREIFCKCDFKVLRHNADINMSYKLLNGIYVSTYNASDKRELFSYWFRFCCCFCCCGCSYCCFCVDNVMQTIMTLIPLYMGNSDTVGCRFNAVQYDMMLRTPL